MKVPRAAGPLLLMMTALTVMVVNPSHAGVEQPTVIDTETVATTVSRKGCTLGQRYSSYHRRCVPWILG